MHEILKALMAQFAELRPQIRVDADQKTASFAIALEQAAEHAATQAAAVVPEPAPVPVPDVSPLVALDGKLDAIVAELAEMRALMGLDVAAVAG